MVKVISVNNPAPTFTVELSADELRLLTLFTGQTNYACLTTFGASISNSLYDVLARACVEHNVGQDLTDDEEFEEFFRGGDSLTTGTS